MRSQILFTRLVITGLAISSFAVFTVGQPGISAVPRQEKLLNGLRVLMWSQPASGNVSVKLRVHAGASFDQQGKEGTMCTLAEAFFPTNEAREFFTDDLGGSLQIVCSYDYIEIDATSKPEAYLTMLELIAGAVTNPSLDRQTAEAAKTRTLSRLSSEDNKAAIAADLAVRKRLFGTFPYGRSPIGSSESIKSIDFADLRFAYDRLFGADNATIAITGNFPSDMAFRAVRRYFGSRLKSDKKVPSTFRQPDPPNAVTQVLESQEKGITEIRYAVRGVARSDRAYAAADVFTKILEQRVRSRAPEDRRDNIWVRNFSYILPGVIVIGFSRIQSEITAAVTGERPKIDANDVIAMALSDPLTNAEFELAKNKASADLTRVDTAVRWLDADTYKLGAVNADQKAFDSVSLSDVQNFADRIKLQPVASVLLLTQKSSN